MRYARTTQKRDYHTNSHSDRGHLLPRGHTLQRHPRTPRLLGLAVSCRPSSPYPGSTASGSFSVENHFFPGSFPTAPGSASLPSRTLPGARCGSPGDPQGSCSSCSSSARTPVLGVQPSPSCCHRLGTESAKRACCPGTYLGFIYFFFFFLMSIF